MTETATAPRVKQQSPRVVVGTRYGSIMVVLNTSTVGIVLTDRDMEIVVRGVPYSVRAEMECGPNGVWRVAGETPHQQYQNCYISRAGSYAEVSRPARKTVEALVVEAITEAVNRNPGIRRQAQQVAINNDIERLEREIATAEAELAEKRQRADSLRADETFLTRGGASAGL